MLDKKQSVFQVKFTVKRPKYKSFVVCGYVLAIDRPEAVDLAIHTLDETMSKIDSESQVKLLSACSLQTDFFLIANKQVETSK